MPNVATSEACPERSRRDAGSSKIGSTGTQTRNELMGTKLLRLEVGGPLLFACMLLIISSSIKGLAFDSSTFWFEIAPELGLWSVGVLFSLAISEQTILRGKITRRIFPTSSENEIKIKYEVTLPDTLEFSPKFLYLFVFEMMIWIITVLITSETASSYSLTNQWGLMIYFYTAVGLVLAGVAIGIAIGSLLEVAS